MEPPDRPSVALACRGVLFDIDGTLVDSTASIVDAWRAVAVELGADPERVAASALSARAAELVEEHFAPEVRERALGLSAEAQVGTAPLITALPGMRELVAALPAGSWGCVTSGRGVIMAARLRAAGLPAPDVLVTAEHVRQGKPAPDPYLGGLAALGLPADDVVVLEDTPEGVASALAAGTRVVGVAGTHPPDALAEAGAVVVVRPGGVTATHDGAIALRCVPALPDRGSAR